MPFYPYHPVEVGHYVFTFGVHVPIHLSVFTDRLVLRWLKIMDKTIVFQWDLLCMYKKLGHIITQKI